MGSSLSEQRRSRQREETREAGQKRATLDLLTMLAATGITQAELAEACGRNAGAVSRWTNDDDQRVPTLGDLDRMPEVAQRWYLRTLAERLGLRLVPAESPEAVLDDIATLGRLSAELGAVLQEEAEAQRDGRYDAVEAESLERRYVEIERAAVSRRARMAEAKRERVDGVRGPLKAV